MSLKTWTKKSTECCSANIERLQDALNKADAVVIGAGAGLSASAGLTYSGERFDKLFSDFIEKYHFSDMYSGGFYPYSSLEEHWAWWSRSIYYNRYVDIPKPVYESLLKIVDGKDCFVITTNVDHCFQRAGFDKKRLFYTQGDYGLWQCSVPCHQETYNNETVVRQMIEQQSNMRIPAELVPYCPKCGKPMTMNLRCDHTFVQDEGWYQAQTRYEKFQQRHENTKVLYLELGVGGNTPGIIKYPFWQMTLKNPKAAYVCLNYGQAMAPGEIEKQSLCIDADVGTVIEKLV